jgi:hypothetical protein
MISKSKSRQLQPGPMRLLSTGTALLLLLGSSPAFAVTQLVTNGDFTMNGGGQLGFNINVPDWTVPAWPNSYIGLWNPQAGTTSGTSADNSGAPDEGGTMWLWGPGNGSTNGLTLSPNGGAFIGSDPAFQNASISQTLTGLTVGKAVTVTFDYAGAQQAGFSGPTEEGWAVSLGAQTLDTAMVSTPNHGFSGWKTASLTFMPTNSSEVLSFMATGSLAFGLPPFALLDGVSATDPPSLSSPTAAPEPSTWAMMLLGFAGLGLIGYHQTRRAKPQAANAAQMWGGAF